MAVIITKKTKNTSTKKGISLYFKAIFQRNDCFQKVERTPLK